jgi:hypothetical protein
MRWQVLTSACSHCQDRWCCASAPASDRVCMYAVGSRKAHDFNTTSLVLAK